MFDENTEKVSTRVNGWHINNKKLSVNDQIYGNTFHARYSRAPLTSAFEVGWPSTTALRKAKNVRSDAIHSNTPVSCLSGVHHWGRTQECSNALVVLLSFYWVKVSQLRFIFVFCLWIIQYAETFIRCIVTYYATCICMHIHIYT